MTIKSDLMSQVLPTPGSSILVYAGRGAIITAGLLANLAEVSLGKNYTLSGDARLSTPRKRMLAGVGAVLYSAAAASTMSAAKKRVVSQPVSDSTKVLQQNANSAVLSVILCGYSLASGKQLWPRKPLSGFGRAAVATLLIASAQEFVEKSVKLYRQSPSAQQRVMMAKVLTPIVAKNLVQKVTLRGRNLETPSVNGEASTGDIARMENLIESLTPEDIARMFSSDPTADQS